MKRALAYGVLASFFFAFTFVFNRSMNLSGGDWMWSAALRFLFMLPMLALILCRGGQLQMVLGAVRRDPKNWLLWSTVGFGLFYAPLSWGSVYGESWFVAACWQVTIVAGVLLTPLFGQKIPLKNLGMSCIILLGVLLLQVHPGNRQSAAQMAAALLLILLAAFCYPLGNRKMMEHCPKELSTVQRVFGMTICSLPFWLVLSLLALLRSGLPPVGQVVQSGAVALFSGCVATILFFRATDLCRGDPHKLALIEATQSGEVVFTLLGGVLLLGDPLPGAAGLIGILLIVGGMVGNSLVSVKR